MTQIVWDQAGERIYEAGVDRCVLYTPNHGALPWNGIISVNENVDGNGSTPVYFDGLKIAEARSPGDYSGTIRAYTFPDEFLDLEGVVDAGNGLRLGNQQPQRFGLSYRTKIGNDIEGNDFAYKIHILYNLLAVPSTKTFLTESNDPAAIQFEWNISAIPERVAGYRPTAHIIFDTREMDPLFLRDIENTLHGTVGTDAQLPPISTLVSFASSWVIIRITDNFDGTWTATGPDNLITMLDGETFQIIQANAIYLDADTYMISDSTH